MLGWGNQQEGGLQPIGQGSGTFGGKGKGKGKYPSPGNQWNQNAYDGSFNAKGGKSKRKGKGDQQLQSLTMLVQQMATSQATLLQALTKQPIPAASQVITPNLLPPPTEAKPTMEERICANCQTSHHSQTLARCRNRKCGQALPIKPGQEPPPMVPITKNKNLTNISNRYGVMEEIEEAPEEKEEGPPDGDQDALMEEEKSQEEARPNPTEEEVKAVKLRLQHYKANPTIFTKEEIKAEEDKLSKMSPPPPEEEILQDRVHKDISFIYHTMDERTRLFNKEKTAIGEEQARLEHQLEEITLKANLQKKKLAGLEATHAADQVRFTKLLQAAQKAAKAPEGTKPPPAPPPPLQLPQDLQNISLAIPEIKAALEGGAGLAGPLLSLVLSSVDFASAAQQLQAATMETIPMGKNIQPGTVPVNTLPLESSGAAAAAGSETSPTEERPNKRDAETPAGDTDSDRQAHKSQAV